MRTGFDHGEVSSVAKGIWKIDSYDPDARFRMPMACGEG